MEGEGAGNMLRPSSAAWVVVSALAQELGGSGGGGAWGQPTGLAGVGTCMSTPCPSEAIAERPHSSSTHYIPCPLHSPVLGPGVAWALLAYH